MRKMMEVDVCDCCEEQILGDSENVILPDGSKEEWCEECHDKYICYDCGDWHLHNVWEDERRPICMQCWINRINSVRIDIARLKDQLDELEADGLDAFEEICPNFIELSRE